MMAQLLNNKMGLLCGILLGGFLYAGENATTVKKIKDLYCQHYDSFEKSVLSERWWINSFNNVLFFGDAAVKKGAKERGYDEFVTEICIPASYPFFGRAPEDIKRILGKIGSNDDIIERVAGLLDKCKQKPDDINFVAHTTYNEGKRLELEKIKRGYAISEEDKDTWTGIGLFAKYVIVDKKILV